MSDGASTKNKLFSDSQSGKILGQPESCLHLPSHEHSAAEETGMSSSRPQLSIHLPACHPELSVPNTGHTTLGRP